MATPAIASRIIFKLSQFIDFDQTCIKIIGLKNSLLQHIGTFHICLPLQVGLVINNVGHTMFGVSVRIGRFMYNVYNLCFQKRRQGRLARSAAPLPGMRNVAGCILQSGNILSWRLVMK